MAATKDFEEWRSAIRSDLKGVSKKYKNGIEKSAKEAFRITQESSRVRTASFKSNWNFSLDSANLSFTDRRVLRQKSVNLRLADAKMNEFQERNANGRSMFMTNTSPYAGILEREDRYLDRAEDSFLTRIDRLLK